ncbi:hypothetical protein PAPYR_355 [Paratrimastix pyriformis]|uniref:Uncharacterized protein n=1 Tax=Paratrimastix pyriformis TaxID=342808 RepID=A0ABQ8UVH0_9EUKA|nr:hypothetical protein PAPYR_355 [Paratrimastix pyriformis]
MRSAHFARRFEQYLPSPATLCVFILGILYVDINFDLLLQSPDALGIETAKRYYFRMTHRPFFYEIIVLLVVLFLSLSLFLRFIRHTRTGRCVDVVSFGALAITKLYIDRLLKPAERLLASDGPFDSLTFVAQLRPILWAHGAMVVVLLSVALSAFLLDLSSPHRQ